MPSYRLVSWNVNGLRAVERKGFLDWFKKESPDVLCLQETKAEPDQLSDAVKGVAGYQVDFCWGEKKGYSGTATYSRRPAAKVERGFGVSEFDREGRILISRFPEFTLFNIYFPNGKRDQIRLDYKLRFYDKCLKTLGALAKKGEKNLVVCGDVNTAHKEIDLARPKENRKISGFLPEECAWIDKLIEAGFIDTFRAFEKGPGHYSWWDMQSRARERNVGWRIDYFFVSQALAPHLKAAAIRPEVMGSDHCPVEATLAF